MAASGVPARRAMKPAFGKAALPVKSRVHPPPRPVVRTIHAPPHGGGDMAVDMNNPRGQAAAPRASVTAKEFADGRAYMCSRPGPSSVGRATSSWSAYGPATVLATGGIDPPLIGETDVPVHARAAGISCPDGVLRLGIPYIVRLFAGWRRPKQPARRAEATGPPHVRSSLRNRLLSECSRGRSLGRIPSWPRSSPCR